MPESEEKELIGERKPDEREIFWAFTSYIFFPIPLISSYKTSKFVRYHIKQSFALFFVLIVLIVLTLFINSFFLKAILYIFLFVIWCFGITYTLLGIEKPLPVIGGLAEKLS